MWFDSEIEFKGCCFSTLNPLSANQMNGTSCYTEKCNEKGPDRRTNGRTLGSLNIYRLSGI